MAHIDICLVGGLEHEYYFSYIGNVIISTDELIFFRGVGIPPTSCAFLTHDYCLTENELLKIMPSFLVDASGKYPLVD